MTIKPIGLSLLALLLWGPLACSKTTMAGPYAPETCEEIGTQDSSLESVDIMGFSAATILDILSTPTTAQVTYLDNTTSTITAQVTYSGGAIQLVEQTPTPAGENWYPEEPCMNHIDIEAMLTLTSEDGLINLEEPVHLRAYQLDNVVSQSEIVSGTLEDLLEASPLTTSSDDRIRYYLDNTWGDGIMSGDLMATVEPNANVSGDASPESIVSISMNYLAEW